MYTGIKLIRMYWRELDSNTWSIIIRSTWPPSGWNLWNLDRWRSLCSFSLRYAKIQELRKNSKSKRSETISCVPSYPVSLECRDKPIKTSCNIPYSTFPRQRKLSFTFRQNQRFLWISDFLSQWLYARVERFLMNEIFMWLFENVEKFTSYVYMRSFDFNCSGTR